MMDHRTDYVNAIEGIVEFLHRPRFRKFWETPTKKGEWRGRFQVVQNLAFSFAVLYKFTGNEEYLALAKRYLTSFELGYVFTSLFCGKTYELIQDSLSPKEREQFAQRWTRDVQGQIDLYVGARDQQFEEWDNVGNLTLCSCVYADYARMLFPAESESYRYEEYTDKVWDVWWKRRDFQEDASNYEGFTECFLCAWAELRGVKKEFYSSPSILNMFERNLRIVSPAGIVTAYGDSGHNEHSTAWIALFEKVAAETENGSYKQTAYEIFTCLKGLGLEKTPRVLTRALDENVYNGRAQYGLYMDMVSWLGMAALWSDPELETSKRTDPAGTITRLPYGYELDESDRRKLPEEKMVTCQVALTGGSPSPDKRTYLLLSVGPKLPHGHADAGAILMLSRDNSCLLGTNGYLQWELLYHNTFYVQETSWERYPEDSHEHAFHGDSECRGVIEELQISDRTSYCRVRFDEYHGFPLSLVRESILDDSGGVTLLDRVQTHEEGFCGGLLFHAEKIRKVSGTSGVKTYQLRTDTLRSTNGIEVKNGRGQLIVELVYPDSMVTVRKLKEPKVYSVGYKEFPTCHYKRTWEQSYTARKCLSARYEFTPGQEVLFLTRLKLGGERDHVK